MAAGHHFSRHPFLRTRSETEDGYDDVTYKTVRSYKKHKLKNVIGWKNIRRKFYSGDVDIFKEVNIPDSEHDDVFQDSNNPYTSVTSFKYYRKFSMDSSGELIKTESPKMETEPIYFDDTIVSAYDAAKHFKICDKHKPPLPKPRHLERQANLENMDMNNSSASEISDAQISEEVNNTEEFSTTDSDQLSFNPPSKTSEHSDPLARSLPLTPSSYDDFGNIGNHLRNTNGHSHLDKDLDWSDSGSLSPISGNSRPNSASSGRRKLPTVPKRNIFNKSVSLNNLTGDTGPKATRELTVPAKFKRTDNSIVVIDDGADVMIEVETEPRLNYGANPDSKSITECITEDKDGPNGRQWISKSFDASISSKSPINALSKTKDRKPKLLPRSVQCWKTNLWQTESKRNINHILTKDDEGIIPDNNTDHIESVMDDRSKDIGMDKPVNGKRGEFQESEQHLKNEGYETNQTSKTNLVSKSENFSEVVAESENVLDIPKGKLDLINTLETLNDPLPPHSFFNFNPAVIQELTDSVMGERLDGTGAFEVSDNICNDTLGDTGKFEVSEVCEAIGDEELQVLNDMDSQIDRAANGEDIIPKSDEVFKSDINDTELIESDKSQEPNANQTVLDIDKPNIHCYRNKVNERIRSMKNRELTARRHQNDADSENVGVVSDSNKENIRDSGNQGRSKVERSSSYRRHVMARAKNRYSKKSSMHKECSCTRNENGEIIVCKFCENYEEKKRSRSCLGMSSAVVKQLAKYDCDDDKDGVAYSETCSPRRSLTPTGLPPRHMSNSPRPLRKVHVSSRVDVLMSSDLFRKHLYKHEYLLEKHTMFRRTGMRKSVSNIDLTEGFVMDGDVDSVNADVEVIVNESNKTDATTDVYAGSSDNEKVNRATNRRHSLTGDSEFLPQNLNSVMNKKKPYRTLPKSIGRSRPSIPNFNDNDGHSSGYLRSKSRTSYIPSFDEFKKMKGGSVKSGRVSVESFEGDKNNSEAIHKDIGSTETKNIDALSSEADASGLVPLQLQVITESSGSQEQLLNAEDHKAEYLRAGIYLSIKKSSQNTEPRDTELKPETVTNSKSVQNVKSDRSKSKISHVESSEEEERVVAQKASPSEKLKQRMRPKLKSKVLVRLDLEDTAHSDTNEPSSKVIVRERKKSGSKRPRSLISKKSSLESLIHLTESKDCNSDNDTQYNIQERPKLKVRSRSESRNNLRSPIPNGQTIESAQSHSELTKQVSLPGKGSNSVQTDMDVTCCSPFDTGDSEETSTSQAESLSDSLRSEYVETSESMSTNDNDDYNKPLVTVIHVHQDGRQSKSPNPDNAINRTREVITKSPVSINSKRIMDSEKVQKSYQQMENSKSENNKVSVSSSTSKMISSMTSSVYDMHLHNSESDSKHSSDPDDDDEEDLFKEEQLTPVLRSTSDACKITQEAARKKRERKERPYKSDPFSGTEIVPAARRCALKEDRARLRQRLQTLASSKEEIMTFLDGVSHGDLETCDSFASLEELNEDDELALDRLEGGKNSPRKVCKHLSNVSSLSTDSGVIGQEGSHDSQQSSPSNTLSHSQSERILPTIVPTNRRDNMSSSCGDLNKTQVSECMDCHPVEKKTNTNSLSSVMVCHQCHHKRIQRKEIIQEIVDTEISYGRDLNILKEEFYKPMLKTGLLNKEQLDSIFLNLEELLHVNKHFITKLKSSINSANQNNDQDLQDVLIGSLFLESSTMFLTFENYIVNQADAPILLEQFEREKELLHIFLQASQKDNQQLRKLHLKAFLMVPVQRIMKYPLLLDRLHKTTPDNHLDKDALRDAKEKIDEILGFINAKSKSLCAQQRKSSTRKPCSVSEKIDVSRVALSTLHWNRKDVCDVITSQLQITQPVDHLWAAKKCKNYKFTTVYGVLFTLTKPSIDNSEDACDNVSFHGNMLDNNNVQVQNAAVVFIKEKNGRYQALREPFMLEKCIVSQDPDFLDVFEILEWNKEAYLIKADSPQETKLWVQNLRQQMKNLGYWRKRRNALPNILLNHLQ